MRLPTERVRADGHVVTFSGELAMRVDRIVGVSPRMHLERTRKVWERGRGRKPSIRALQASHLRGCRAAAATRGDRIDRGSGVVTCTVVRTPQGAAIVCSRTEQPRCACGKRAALLCDWKVPKNPSGTCDAPVCDACATSPAPGKDLCARHGADYRRWQADHAQPGSRA